MKKILFMMVMTAGISGYSQVGVGTSTPDASAQLDVVATNKGVLVPRVSLTGSTDIATIASPKESLLVYNTVAVSDVVPGFYYWNAVKWVALSGGGGPAGNIAIANGGTGATTAPEALTNLGAQGVANLTTTLGTTVDHYPSESAVKTYVDAETTRATAAEAGIQTATTAETTRATGVETVLQNSVTAESTRATAAETALQTEVTTETTRANNAEGVLTTAITAETIRATAQEALKEVLTNKSTSITPQVTDDAYPSVKAVKAYVDAAPSFYGTDGTLASARTVTQNNNNLTFTTGTGKLLVDGTLQQGGGVFSKFQAVTTAAYTVANTTNTIVYQGGSDAVFTLPAPASNAGMELKIFNVSGFNVAFPAGTFSGGTSNSTVFTGTGAILFCDGTLWYFLLGAL